MSRVSNRENEIIRILKRLPHQRGTVKDIYAKSGDTAQISSWHRVVKTMVDKGRLTRINSEEEPVAIYTVVEGKDIEQLPLFSEETYSKYDYEQIAYPGMIDRTAAAMYQRLLIDSQGGRDAIREAFRRLCRENPRHLMLQFVKYCYDKAYSALANWKRSHKREDAEAFSSYSQIVDEVGNRGLGIHTLYLYVPRDVGEEESPRYEEQAIAKHLEKVVHGDYFINELQLTPEELDEARTMVVTGTDASSHLDEISRITPTFTDNPLPIAVNNAAAFWKYGPDVTKNNADLKSPRELMPQNISQIDNPDFRGQIVGPDTYDRLSEDKYKRVVASAMDGVHYRMDGIVTLSTAKTKPHVLFRDGRIFPLEHKFNNFLHLDEYGDQVRYTLEQLQRIVQYIRGAASARTLYCGVVKEAELRIFSRLLDWYIRVGSGEGAFASEGPIKSDWPETFNPIKDGGAMTELLSVGEANVDRGCVLVTAQITREFSTIAGYYKNTDFRDNDTQPPVPITDWVAYFERRKKLDREHAHLSGDPLPPICTLNIDPFVELCAGCNVTMFYMGQKGQQQRHKQVLLPRYEFMHPIADADVLPLIKKLVQGVVVAGVLPDINHMFMSNQKRYYLLPSVQIAADLDSRHLGEAFMLRFKQAVFAKYKEIIDQGGIVDIRPSEIIAHQLGLRSPSADHQLVDDRSSSEGLDRQDTEESEVIVDSQDDESQYW